LKRGEAREIREKLVGEGKSWLTDIRNSVKRELKKETIHLNKEIQGHEVDGRYGLKGAGKDFAPSKGGRGGRKLKFLGDPKIGCESRGESHHS